MENKGNTVVAVDAQPEQPERETYVPEHCPSELYYQEMARNHAGFVSNYLTTPDSFETLYHRTRRLKHLFIALNRPWLSGSREIQKACAYYLMHADLSKEGRNAFMHVLGDIAHTVCYLAAYGDFISQMQRYYRHQEKELRFLLDEKKAIERRRKESAERLSAEGMAYSLTVGKGEIYGITYPQLKELYRIMGLFIEREKSPFQCNVKSYDEYEIGISKYISLYADRDDYFFTDYSLSTFEGQLQCMPAGQLKRIADTIQEFLRVFGENGEKKVHWDMADYPAESQPDIAFEIREDGRLPRFRTVPWISKCIHKNEGEETEISYFIDVNEIHSPELSFGEFVAVYRKLGNYLSSQPESVDLARG